MRVERAVGKGTDAAEESAGRAAFPGTERRIVPCTHKCTQESLLSTTGQALANNMNIKARVYPATTLRRLATPERARLKAVEQQPIRSFQILVGIRSVPCSRQPHST